MPGDGTNMPVMYACLFFFVNLVEVWRSKS
jgi:hypothetical protein